MTIEDLPRLPIDLPLATILTVVEEAREAILHIYRGTTMAVEYKQDNSPLTLADRHSHAILSEGLLRMAPRVPILSEEGQTSAWEIRRQWPYFWLIDPLDGTRDFVDHTDEFTINVALIHQNRAIVGFLDVPMRATTYLGIEGQGAYRIGPQRQVTSIAAAQRSPSQPLRCAVSRSHGTQEASWMTSQGLSVSQWIQAGSALKFALVAEGTADIYPRLGPTMEWDTAAGHCLVEAAGGSVQQLDDHRDLHYNRENLTNPAFVARGGVI